MQGLRFQGASSLPRQGVVRFDNNDAAPHFALAFPLRKGVTSARLRRVMRSNNERAFGRIVAGEPYMAQGIVAGGGLTNYQEVKFRGRAAGASCASSASTTRSGWHASSQSSSDSVQSLGPALAPALTIRPGAAAILRPLKLFTCYGTFKSRKPEGHPCRTAYEALTAAGHEPRVARTGGCDPELSSWPYAGSRGSRSRRSSPRRRRSRPAPSGASSCAPRRANAQDGDRRRARLHVSGVRQRPAHESQHRHPPAARAAARQRPQPAASCSPRCCFSRLGSPVLYYGDEIGMGDNIWLGDRDAVRTPMQWTPDRNAGFSRSDPGRIYLPPIMDPTYGYEAINVEAQQGQRNVRCSTGRAG